METADGLRARMADEVGRMRGLGYRHAMVFVTPEEKRTAVADGTFAESLGEGIVVHPSVGSDNVRRDRGDAAHEFFMAIFGDMFRLADVKAKAPKAKAPKAKAKSEGAVAKGAKPRVGARKTKASQAVGPAKAKPKREPKAGSVSPETDAAVA